MEDIKVYPLEIRFDFVFLAVDAVDENDLLDHLKEKGFEESKIPKIGRVDEDFTLKKTNIAEKGKCDILYDRDRVSIMGRHSKEILYRVDETEKILKDLEVHTKCFGFNSTYRIASKSKNPPLYSISRFLGNKFKGITDILSVEVAPFSLRFFPKNKIDLQEDIKTQPEWFDIQIYPYIVNPQYYGATVVFRDPDLQKTKSFLGMMESKLLDIIRLIEKETEGEKEQ